MDSSIDEAAALPDGADGAAADPASGTVGSGDREDGREAAGPVPGGGPVVSGGGAETAGTAETTGDALAGISPGTTGDAATNSGAEPNSDGGTQETAGDAATNGTTPETAGDAVVSGDVGGGGAVGVAGERKAVAPTSLSPSRASDFMQCPLLYRFRVIDRLPEKPSAAATRGTLVHAVLERLFDAPAGERTAPRAKSLIPGQWDRLRESRPEVTELFADDPEGERLAGWLAEAERLVERWFTLEDPTRLEPAERELFVEAELESGLRLRGIIDRVDVAPTGEVRIVDYKTGKAPRPEYAEGALFQMKFYALVVWRLKRVVPRRLQLVYLGSGDVLTYDPVPADLERVERKLHALWEAIRQATETGNWRPRPTKLCGWCDHQAHCPEFGGTPPPYPLPVGTPGSGTV